MKQTKKTHAILKIEGGNKFFLEHHHLQALKMSKTSGCTMSRAKKKGHTEASNVTLSHVSSQQPGRWKNLYEIISTNWNFNNNSTQVPSNCHKNPAFNFSSTSSLFINPKCGHFKSSGMIEKNPNNINQPRVTLRFLKDPPKWHQFFTENLIRALRVAVTPMAVTPAGMI